MALQFHKPILYLITRGASKPSTTSKGPEFQSILTQVSAAHSREDLEFAVNAFAEVNEELK